MSELLFMTSTVLAGLLACLSRPGCPEYWACVKSPRLTELPPPQTAEQGVAEEWEDAPGFSDGLAQSAIG